MKTKSILTFVLIMMGFTSCNYVKDILDLKEEKTSFVADISAETDYDFLAYSGDDDSFIAVKQNNGLPIEALIRTSAGVEPYPVWFNGYGNVEKIVINSHILLFRNYSANKFDLAIISPDGEVTPVREIPIPVQHLKSLRLKSANITLENTGEALVVAGHAIGIFKCVSSLVVGASGTAASLGIGTPAAAALIALGCGSTAVGLAIEWAGDEKIAKYLDLPLKTVKAFTASVQCSSGITFSCFTSMAGFTISSAGSIIRAHERDIKLAEGVLLGGYGDIQITLTWDSSADIDLYVQDPAGEFVWYHHKNSISGGWLDVDDTNGYGPENIKWNINAAPDGIYNVYVRHYSGGFASYSVLVQAFGRIKQFVGSIAPGQTIFLTDFSKTYLKNANIQEKDEILPWSAK